MYVITIDKAVDQLALESKEDSVNEDKSLENNSESRRGERNKEIAVQPSIFLSASAEVWSPASQETAVLNT